MINDRKISLPRSMGPFTVSGMPENGRAVWYSIRFWNMEYSVFSSGSVAIRGTATIRKQVQWLSKTLDWLPSFFTRWPIWEFTDRITGLSGPTSGDYQSDLATEALKEGVVLDKRFFEEVCREAKVHLDDLHERIANEYSSRPRLTKVA